MRRHLLGLAAMSVAFGVTIPVAQAADPVAGCGKGARELVTVEFMAADSYEILVDKVTFPTVESWAAFVTTTDKNGDGHVCYNVGNPSPGHDGAVHFFWRDNTSRLH